MKAGEKLTKTESSKLKVFFIVAFGMPVIMGILMGISFYAGNDVSIFANTQMYFPAAGVMLAAFLVRNKEDKIPHKFFIGFLVLTVVMVIFTVMSLIIPQLAWTIYIQYVIIAGSVICWVLFLLEKKEVRKQWGLHILGYKKSKSALYVLLFLVLYFIRIAVSLAVEGQLSQFTMLMTDPATYYFLVILLINFFLVFTAFFGEEYGWRYFLQPLLQKKFGLICGVLLLGVMWGLWHLPINIFYYSPTTWMQSITVHQITCITFSIFFGFCYMVTKNIWVPVMIHYFNNNLALLFTPTGDIGNQVYRWSDILLLLIINGVVFGPFLFAKVFRRKKEDHLQEAEGLTSEKQEDEAGKN